MLATDRNTARHRNNVHEFVGVGVHRQLSGSELALLDATGQCPDLSAPAELSAVLRARLGRS